MIVKDTKKNEAFLKKISILLFQTINELNEIKTEESKAISKKIQKIDKELLKHFEIKLTDSTKKSAIELMDMFK